MYSSQGVRSPGRPPRLHLDDVLAAATALIEAEGAGALTMRAVAEACSVTPMALYRHVRTRNDLIALVANRAIDAFDLPESAGADWREEVRLVVGRMHEFLLEHPDFASIFASRPIDSIVAYRAVERILRALERAGLDDDLVIASYDLLISFIRGFVQQHAGPRAQANSPVQRISVIGHLDPDAFAHVIRLGGRLITRDPHRDFDEELAILLDGIQARVPVTAGSVRSGGTGEIG
jgi:AcrR family transcriptional regulator